MKTRILQNIVQQKAIQQKAIQQNSNVQNKISKAKKSISIGNKYIHYKGGVYNVVGLAINENTQDVDVIYHPEDGNVLFTRPIKQWNEKMSFIDWNGPIAGLEIIKKRFEKLT